MKDTETETVGCRANNPTFAQIMDWKVFAFVSANGIAINLQELGKSSIKKALRRSVDEATRRLRIYC